MTVFAVGLELRKALVGGAAHRATAGVCGSKMPAGIFRLLVAEAADSGGGADMTGGKVSVAAVLVGE